MGRPRRRCPVCDSAHRTAPSIWRDATKLDGTLRHPSSSCEVCGQQWSDMLQYHSLECARRQWWDAAWCDCWANPSPVGPQDVEQPHRPGPQDDARHNWRVGDTWLGADGWMRHYLETRLRGRPPLAAEVRYDAGYSKRWVTREKWAAWVAKASLVVRGKTREEARVNQKRRRQQPTEEERLMGLLAVEGFEPRPHALDHSPGAALIGTFRLSFTWGEVVVRGPYRADGSDVAAGTPIAVMRMTPKAGGTMRLEVPIVWTRDNRAHGMPFLTRNDTWALGVEQRRPMVVAAYVWHAAVEVYAPQTETVEPQGRVLAFPVPGEE